MTQTTPTTPDTLQKFLFDAAPVRGELVRMEATWQEVLGRHSYPTPVRRLLGEMMAAAALLSANLKFNGALVMQLHGDGPVRMLVVDYTTPGRVRACARFDAARVAAAVDAGSADPGTLLGSGHLAMTIDQGPDTARYQGIVALEGKGLEHVAHEYFLRSEQIPTCVRLAVAEELRAGGGGAQHRWRAGGLVLQFLPVLADEISKNLAWLVYGALLIASVWLAPEGVVGLWRLARQRLGWQ